MTEPRLGISFLPDQWAPESPAGRRRLLAMAESTGIDDIVLSDHLTFRGGWGCDGLVAAASVLAATDRLGAFVSAYLLALRHPVAVARAVATVAQLAAGRITLGVGVGGEDRSEIEACGVDPRTRGRRTDEALAVLRRLLSGEKVSFDGEFFRLAETSVLPAPDPPVPLVIAGRSAAALRRAGRLGDGWLGIWVSAQRCAEALEAIAAHAADAGRHDVDWHHGMTFWCGFGRDRAEARSRVAPAMESLYGLAFDAFERYTPYGTPAEVAEFVGPYLDAGCTTLTFAPHAGSAEAGVEAVAAVRDALGIPEPMLTAHTGG